MNFSCTYSEKLIIWQSYATSQLIQQAGVTGLAVYGDGSLIGTFLTTNYWTGTPSCSQSGNASVTVDMGMNLVKTVNIEFRDQNNVPLWTDQYTMVAGDCNTYEIQ